MKACELPREFRFLYADDDPIERKIEILATKVYNAADVSYDQPARDRVRRFTDLGWGRLPICMAKTHLSLAHKATMKNVPSGYTFPIRDIKAAVGAGFLYPMAGTFPIMPGLPSRPAAVDVDLDLASGRVRGLF